MATGRGGRGVSQLAFNYAALASASASLPYPKSGVISGRPSLMWLCIADLELDAAAREFRWVWLNCLFSGECALPCASTLQKLP